MPSKVRSSAAPSVVAQEPVLRPQEQQDEASEQQFSVVTHRPTQKPQLTSQTGCKQSQSVTATTSKNVKVGWNKGARAAVDQAHKEITD